MSRNRIALALAAAAAAVALLAGCEGNGAPTGGEDPVPTAPANKAPEVFKPLNSR
jgi:hypothetical protein